MWLLPCGDCNLVKRISAGLKIMNHCGGVEIRMYSTCQRQVWTAIYFLVLVILKPSENVTPYVSVFLNTIKLIALTYVAVIRTTRSVGSNSTITVCKVS